MHYLLGLIGGKQKWCPSLAPGIQVITISTEVGSRHADGTRGDGYPVAEIAMSDDIRRVTKQRLNLTRLHALSSNVVQTDSPALARASPAL